MPISTTADARAHGGNAVCLHAAGDSPRAIPAELEGVIAADVWREMDDAAQCRAIVGAHVATKLRSVRCGFAREAKALGRLETILAESAALLVDGEADELLAEMREAIGTLVESDLFGRLLDQVVERADRIVRDAQASPLASLNILG